jgi:hypothetical protein
MLPLEPRKGDDDRPPAGRCDRQRLLAQPGRTPTPESLLSQPAGASTNAAGRTGPPEELVVLDQLRF